MIELNEKATIYAAEKTNEIMTKAVAQAYADGYRDGYKDREDEIPVDLRNDKIEFVDLGLPSGTLWATDYEKEEGETIRLPYGKSELLGIPTKDQWAELCNICKWEYNINDAHVLLEARCVGPNGNVLQFGWTGKTNIKTISDFYEVFFWVKDDSDGNEKNAAHIYNAGKANNINVGVVNTEKYFSGYKLPIRLVKTK